MEYDERNEQFRNQLLSSIRTGLILDSRFFELLRKPEIMTYPTIRRMHIASAVLALEEIRMVRDQLTLAQESAEDSANFEADNYNLNTRIGSCYEKLNEFFVGDCLTTLEKQDVISPC